MHPHSNDQDNNHQTIIFATRKSSDALLASSRLKLYVALSVSNQVTYSILAMLIVTDKVDIAKNTR